MRILCYVYVGFGVTISGVGRFLGVVDIGLVAGSTLGVGVGFARELEFWFLYGVVLSVSTLGAPLVFTLIVLHVVGCTFSSCLVVGSLYLLFIIPFGFTHGFVLV